MSLQITRTSLVSPTRLRHSIIKLDESSNTSDENSNTNRSGHALLVATMNQVLLLGVAFLLWQFFPGHLTRRVLTDITVSLDMGCSIGRVSSRIGGYFYSTHPLLHTDWFWNHVHYFHHQQEAPFPPCCIYAHPGLNS